MFNISAEKMMLVLLVALALLGPDKLPQAARQYGKFMATVHRLRAGLSAELDTMVEHVTRYDPTDSDRNQDGESLASPVPAPPADDAIRPHTISVEHQTVDT